MSLVEKLSAIAEKKGYSGAQLALAWVHAQGDDVFPIPGTSSLTSLSSNLQAASIKFSTEDLKAIESACPQGEAQGDRYGHMAMTYHGNKDQ